MEIFLQSLFDEAVAEGVFPGCCACVLYQDKAYTIVSGNRALYPVEEVNTVSTYYDLASLSKVVSTSMIVLQLVQQERIDLDLPIQAYLKDCPWQDITVRHLMTHTSGLQADLEVTLKDHKETVKQRIYEARRGLLGEVVYSDCGYMILQFVLEAVAGMPLDELAKEYVFEPLHLTHTLYCPSKMLISSCAPTEYSDKLGRIIRGEVHDEKAYQLNGIAGHAGVFSTIGDLEQYARRFLKREDSYLCEALKKECCTPQYTDMSIPRGLGYLCASKDISDLISDEVAYHTGFCGNSILMDRKQHLAIIVLSNRVHPTRKNEKILSWRKTMHDRIIRELKHH